MGGLFSREASHGGASRGGSDAGGDRGDGTATAASDAGGGEATETVDATHYAYPPACGQYFGEYFVMGGQRFEAFDQDTFLFGPLADINFMASGHVGTLSCAPPPHMRHTTTLRSFVNVHKETLRLVRTAAEHGLGQYYPEFTFDADLPCKITVYYFATASYDAAGRLAYRTARPEHEGPTVEFGPGLNQKFSDPSFTVSLDLVPESDLNFSDPRSAEIARRASSIRPRRAIGTASGSSLDVAASTSTITVRPLDTLRVDGLVDLSGRVVTDEALQPDAAQSSVAEGAAADEEGLPPGDVVLTYPMVVLVECSTGSLEHDPNRDAPVAGNPALRDVQSQSTIVSLETSAADGIVAARVLKQRVCINGVNYLEYDIFGAEQSQGKEAPGEGESEVEGEADDAENTTECVVCMCDPRDTVVLPCRHLCLCNDCASTLRYQSSKCPICRASFHSLLQLCVSKPVADASHVARALGVSLPRAEQGPDRSTDALLDIASERNDSERTPMPQIFRPVPIVEALALPMPPAEAPSGSRP